MAFSSSCDNDLASVKVYEHKVSYSRKTISCLINAGGLLGMVSVAPNWVAETIFVCYLAFSVLLLSSNFVKKNEKEFMDLALDNSNSG